MTEARQRIDVWLHRARFAKTRAAAARLVTEGGVRVVRDGASRQIDKPSAEISVGDALVLPFGRALRAIRIQAVGARRGPAAEARALYTDLDKGEG
jgi:ribosome-associated heat shock protein Hsp15